VTLTMPAAVLAGDQWAYIAGIIAVLLGAARVFVMFPKREEEEDLLVEYHAQDVASQAAIASRA
jgi:MFS transporter, DHA2 family, multidrug resistance protein